MFKAKQSKVTLVLFSILTLPMFLIPCLTAAESGYIHKNIFTQAINKVFQEDRRLGDSVLTHLADHSPFGTGDERVSDHTYCPKFQYLEYPPEDIPGGLLLGFTNDPDPSLPNALELIGNESILTDYYGETKLIIQGSPHAYYVFNDMVLTFASFSHFGDRFRDNIGWNCHDVWHSSILSPWDGIDTGIDGCIDIWIGIWIPLCARIQAQGALDAVACELFESQDIYIDLEQSTDSFVKYTQGRWDDIENLYNVFWGEPPCDLGYDECDQRFMPVWRIGAYWLWNYLCDCEWREDLGEYSNRGWYDGEIRFLGPPAHALADIGVPHHAYGVIGNFHSAWEGYTNHLWRQIDEDEGVSSYIGQSPKCQDPDYSTGFADCMKKWASDYLSRADAEADTWPTGYDYDYTDASVIRAIGFFRGLYEEVKLDSLGDYENLFPRLEEAIEEHVDAQLATTPDPPPREEIPECWSTWFEDTCGPYLGWTPSWCTSHDSSGEAWPTKEVKRLGGTAFYLCQNMRYCYDPDLNEYQCTCCDGDYDPETPVFNPSTGFHNGAIPGTSAWSRQDMDRLPDYTNANIDEIAYTQIDRSIAASLALLGIAISDGTPIADTDGDTMIDFLDNCPDQPNADQADMDGDDYGDVCDGCDNDPDIYEGNDEDRDGNVDACDYCPKDNPTWHEEWADDPSIDDRSLGRQGDRDEDTIHDRCDNCLYTPNIDQENCNLDWEIEEALAAGEDSFPGIGDACDPDPCLAFYGDSGEPAQWGRNVDMRLRATGYDPPRHDTEWPVTKGHCDCTGFSDRDDCNRLGGCLEDGTLVGSWQSPTILVNNWFYDNTVVEAGDIERVHFHQLYRGVGEGRTCDPDSPLPGCSEEDFHAFYDTGVGRHSIYDVTWNWWDALPCPNGPFPAFPSCNAKALLFFKPLVPGWPDRKNSLYDYMDLDLMEGEFPFYNPSDWLRTMYVYAPFANEGCPVWREKVKDVFLIKFFDRGCPIDEPEKWAFESIEPSSATQGMMIGKFDKGAGRFDAFYTSTFVNATRIIDVKNPAMTREFMRPEAVIQFDVDGVADNGAISPIVADLGRLWVFGGRDLAGLRSDLWVGTPVQHSETSFSWEEIAPSQGGGPSPREGAFLVFDNFNDRLVLFSGRDEEGWKKDMWFFDLASQQWRGMHPRGDIPDLNDAYGVTQHMGYAYFIDLEHKVTGINHVYVLDIPFAVFTKKAISPPPAGLAAASAAFDPDANSLYVYGGFDGQDYHNHLYRLDMSTGAWNQVAEDCTAGACPPPSVGAAVLREGSGDRTIVMPGMRPDGEFGTYADSYFVLAEGEWTGSREIQRLPDAGDCNADGLIEDGYGLRCANHDAWWQEPGRNVCDTFTSSLTCSQQEPPDAEIFSRFVRGARSMQAFMNTVYIARGNKILSIDASQPSSPVVLDRLRIGAPVRQIELSGNLLALAQDAAIALVDVTDPSNMVLLGEAAACGRPVALEIGSNSIYFITPLGMGEIDISDLENPFVERFSWLLPGFHGDWYMVEEDVELCGYISDIADLLCWLMRCPGASNRGFDLAGGNAYISALRSMVIVDTHEGAFEIDSVVGLDFRASSLEHDDGYVYLNLKRGKSAVFDVSDPSMPVYMGGHDVGAWVDGIEFEAGRAYRLDGRRVDVAVWDQP